MRRQPTVPSPTVTISRREAAGVAHRLDDLLDPAPEDPFDFADCLALGAWRRLVAGERAFTPAMWDVIKALQRASDRRAQRRTASPVRELTDAEAVDLYRNMIVLHASLATGDSTHGSPVTDAKALLAAAGVIAALELGATRFAGQSWLDFIDQPPD